MDAIDRQLLDLLRRSGRLAYAELARKVGLSAPAVHERIGKLEAAGVIRGYHADVDPDSIDLGVTALVRIVHDTNVDIDDLIAGVHRFDEVESCYFLAGEESLLLKIRVGTIAELEQIVVNLGRTPGVASTRTTIALSTKWEGRPRPLT